MLKPRVITALILIPLLVSAVLLLPTLALAYIFAIFITAAAWEWSRLSGFTSIISRLAYIVLTAVIMFNLYHWAAQPDILYYILYAVFIWWLFAFLWLSIASAKQLLANAYNVYFRGLIGLILLIPAWLAILALHMQANNGPYLLLSLFIIIWIADSGAYFSGRFFGKTKLAPKISPGKTLEGVYGALFTTLPVAVIIAIAMDYNLKQIIAFSSVALFCTIFSIVGDLFESAAKRSAGVKDSGNVFPGHGGVLDRIDSLTAASPMFLLGLSWFPGLL